MRRARVVTFRAVSGHRDGTPTDCPGALIYPELDAIAAAAQASGSPKIVDAAATPARLGDDASGNLVPIAFRARVLGGASWTVTVLDAHGAPVASNSGSGETIAWSWPGTRSDGTPLVPGTKLAYRIDAQDAAGVAARPLLGSLGALPEVIAAPPLALAPTVVSPDGDGIDDRLAINYTLEGPSTVTLDVLAPDGTTVDALVPGAQVPAGGQSARWGAEGPAGLVADGVYTVRLSVTDALGRVAQRSGAVTVIRAVRKLKLSRPAAGLDASVTALWQQTQPAALSAELSSARRTIPAPPLPADAAPGPQSVELPATLLATLPDGTYSFVLHARTAVGEQVLRESFKLDRHPPVARLLRFRVHKGRGGRGVRLSDAGTMRVRAGARVVVPRRPRGAGLNGFRFRLPPGVPADSGSSSSTPRAMPRAPGRSGRDRASRESELIVSSEDDLEDRREARELGAVGELLEPRRARWRRSRSGPRTSRRRRRAASSVSAAWLTVPRPGRHTITSGRPSALARSAVVRFQPIGASRPDGPRRARRRCVRAARGRPRARARGRPRRSRRLPRAASRCSRG